MYYSEKARNLVLYVSHWFCCVCSLGDYISTQEPRTYLTAFVSMFILSFLKKHVHFSNRCHNALSFLVVSYLVVLGLSLPITIKLSSISAIYILSTNQLVAARTFDMLRHIFKLGILYFSALKMCDSHH